MAMKDWKESINIPNALLTTILFLIINQALESSRATDWIEEKVDTAVQELKGQVN